MKYVCIGVKFDRLGILEMKERWLNCCVYEILWWYKINVYVLYNGC